MKSTSKIVQIIKLWTFVYKLTAELSNLFFESAFWFWGWCQTKSNPTVVYIRVPERKFGVQWVQRWEGGITKSPRLPLVGGGLVFAKRIGFWATQSGLGHDRGSWNFISFFWFIAEYSLSEAWVVVAVLDCLKWWLPWVKTGALPAVLPSSACNCMGWTKDIYLKG